MKNFIYFNNQFFAFGSSLCITASDPAECFKCPVLVVQSETAALSSITKIMKQLQPHNCHLDNKEANIPGCGVTQDFVLGPIVFILLYFHCSENTPSLCLANEMHIFWS